MQNNPIYRNKLPQLRGVPLLTDSGLETSMIFHEKIDLPHFAAFDLLNSLAGRSLLQRYYTQHADLARQHNVGFILDTPTWRASQDWGNLLGYSREELAAVNKAAAELLFDLRCAYDSPTTPFVVSGNLGPRGDGYDPAFLMNAGTAQLYHTDQINVFADAGVDMITAMTMTHVGEAIGIAQAASRVNVPVVISFTVETDGRLPSGQVLGDAIDQVDTETTTSPVYYMINCAHPDHFKTVVSANSHWATRILGIRANASRQSHAELDTCTVLDAGDQKELGDNYAALMENIPGMVVFGGCCGTDHRHIDAIASACLSKVENLATN